MFKSSIILFSILYFFNITTIAASDYDAEIILNKKTFRYSLSKDKVFSITTNIVRKVKVNTSFGLQQFNKLYIPVLKDIGYKININDLVAKTIKQNGEILEVNKDRILETTLPANIPFLRNYRGAVKQLAFENLEVGDIIEYSYTIKMATSGISYAISQIDIESLVEQYPISESIIEYDLDASFGGNFYCRNTFSQFKESGKNKYVLRLTDLSPVDENYYTNIYDDHPYYAYHIYNNDHQIFKTWENYFRSHLTKVDKSSFLFGGKSFVELYRKLNVKKESYAPYEIISLIRDSIYNIFVNNPKGIISSEKNYNISFEDVSELLKLLDYFKIEGSVLFLKNRFSGDYFPEIIDIGQFNDILLEFKDQDGNSHYWSPYHIFMEIDNYSDHYKGTEALKVEKSENNFEISKIKMPKPDYNDNQFIEESEYTLILENDSLKAKIYSSFIETGSFSINTYNLANIEILDSSNHYFKEMIKNRLSDEYENFNLLKWDIQNTISSNDNNFNMTYECNIKYSQSSEVIYFNLSDLLRPENYIPYLYQRETDFWFTFPYIKTYTLKLSPPSGYQAYPNKLLNFSFSNEVSDIHSNISMEGDYIILRISYSIKESIISKKDMHKLVDYSKHLSALFENKILFERF